MSLMKGVLYSMVSTLTLSSPPLYRYPYRNSLEAFRSDWKRVGKDIETAQQSFFGASEGDPDEQS